MYKQNDLEGVIAAGGKGNSARVFTLPKSTARTARLAPTFANTTVGQVYRAIHEGRTSVAYQPQFDANSRAMVGVEALFRLKDPQGNNVSPGAFIAEIERASAVQVVTRRVLEQACLDLADWQQRSHSNLRMSVNITTMDLESEYFLDFVAHLAISHGIAAEQLDFEVVERHPILPGSHAEWNLIKLSEAGVQVTIDDFGTGYTSLEILEQLPADRVKLDRSIIVGMTHDANVRATALEAVQRAHSLGMQVVAEGIETEEQHRCSIDLGCDLVQGFLFARPAPKSEIDALLTPRVVH